MGIPGVEKLGLFQEDICCGELGRGGGGWGIDRSVVSMSLCIMNKPGNECLRGL